MKDSTIVRLAVPTETDFGVGLVPGSFSQRIFIVDIDKSLGTRMAELPRGNFFCSCGGISLRSRTI